MSKGIRKSGINKGWFKKGKHPLNEFKKGHKFLGDLSKPNYFQKGMVPWCKGKRILQISGKNHYNWKGGISNENRKIKQSNKYNQWRLLVYKRDYFTCQKCGHKHTNIIAHHIKSFAECENLRFNVNNGITLCRNCHTSLHTRKRTKLSQTQINNAKKLRKRGWLICNLAQKYNVERHTMGNYCKEWRQISAHR